MLKIHLNICTIVKRDGTVEWIIYRRMHTHIHTHTYTYTCTYICRRIELLIFDFVFLYFLDHKFNSFFFYILDEWDPSGLIYYYYCYRGLDNGKDKAR